MDPNVASLRRQIRLLEPAHTQAVAAHTQAVTRLNDLTGKLNKARSALRVRELELFNSHVLLAGKELATFRDVGMNVFSSKCTRLPTCICHAALKARDAKQMEEQRKRDEIQRTENAKREKWQIELDRMLRGEDLYSTSSGEDEEEQPKPLPTRALPDVVTIGDDDDSSATVPTAPLRLPGMTAAREDAPLMRRFRERQQHRFAPYIITARPTPNRAGSPQSSTSREDLEKLIFDGVDDIPVPSKRGFRRKL